MIFGYRVRAIGTRVSVVPPIGAGSLGVRSIVSPRCCIGLTPKPMNPIAIARARVKLWCILVSLANPRPILRRALGWHLIKTTRFLEVRWILPGLHNGAPSETPGVAKIEAGGGGGVA